ncbi:MAG: hypothetical protein WCD35_17220 [Mycobacteriales bacterium]
MTTTGPAAPAAQPDRTRTGLWIALAALLVGAVVAVLGVRAAVMSYQRDQAIRDYAHARTAAVYFTKNGDTISASMKRLQALDEEDVTLMRAQRAALDANNVSSFNSLADSANSRTAQQQALHNQVKDFQSAFAQAQNR